MIEASHILIMEISIIVPIYNTESYLARCVESILSQSFSDYELLLVDDGSTDESGNMCDAYAEKDERVQVFHKKNSGVSSTRNIGINEAKGKFVCFVDADDWLEKDAMELLVKKQLENEADIISGNRIIHYHCGDSLFEEKKYSNSREMILQMMQYGWDHFITGRLIRRSLFVDHGLRCKDGLDVAEDRYMMTSLAYYMKGFATINDVVYHYNRRNEGSLTGNDNGLRRTKNSIQQLGNCLLIEQFFKDKEPDYLKESTRCVMEQMDRCIKTSLAYSLKDSFYEIVRIIDSRSDDDIRLIGWEKNGIKGWYLHNYYTMRLDWRINKTIRFAKRKLKC